MGLLKPLGSLFLDKAKSEDWPQKTDQDQDDKTCWEAEGLQRGDDARLRDQTTPAPP